MFRATAKRAILITLLTCAALSGCNEQSSPQVDIISTPGIHDCAERAAVIETRYQDIQLKGQCWVVTVRGTGNSVSIASARQILVDGAGNVLNIGAADDITVNGAGNQVAYAQGLTKARPAVLAVGDNNKLVQLR